MTSSLVEKSKDNLVERILITREEMLSPERTILRDEHLRRYGAIRRFCYGRVLEFASGCGYGAAMIAVNPDVSEVVGVDNDEAAIAWAIQEYSHPKISFKVASLESLDEQFGTLVCLETIEHLKDVQNVCALIERCQIDNLIISFPDKKTTHYNPFHYHDFVKQEIIDLFPRHLPYHALRFVDSQSILFVRAPKNAPTHIFRNLQDL